MTCASVLSRVSCSGFDTRDLVSWSRVAGVVTTSAHHDTALKNSTKWTSNATDTSPRGFDRNLELPLFEHYFSDIVIGPKV